jgi:hypothetical protein
MTFQTWEITKMATDSYPTATSPELSRDDIARGIVRLNEIVANLTLIQRTMTENAIEKFVVTEPHLLTSSVDSLIQFVGQVEQALTHRPPEE